MSGPYAVLQHEVQPEDRPALDKRPHIGRAIEATRDFADTAALIDHLDLVVTVDTIVAHLAAALGKPVWVVVHVAADWRWLAHREDSPGIRRCGCSVSYEIKGSRLGSDARPRC